MRKPWVLVFALVSVGCPSPEESEVFLQAITGAPPTLEALLVNDVDNPRLRMSQGVAMAVTCSDYCPKVQNTCEGASLSARDDVLEVHDAFDATGYRVPSFVVTAKRAGSTELTITTRCGSKTYRAVVE